MWKANGKTLVDPWRKRLGQKFKPSAFLLLVGLSACTTTSVQQGTATKEKILTASEGRTSMVGSVKFTQETDSGSITLPGTLLLSWPDRARLEVQDPFGGVQLLLILDQGKFWMYRSDWKENLQGQVKEFPLLSSLPVRGEDFLPVFLARPKLTDWKAEEGFFESPRKEKVYWDNRYQVDRWLHPLRDQQQAEVRYGEWVSKSGTLFPTKISFRWTAPGKSRSVQLQWDEWSAESSPRAELFQIPPKQSFGKTTKALPIR